MPALRGIALQPIATSGATDTALVANDAPVTIRSVGAALTTTMQLAATSSASVTATSTDISTAIRMASNATVSFISTPPTMDVLQYISGTTTAFSITAVGDLNGVDRQFLGISESRISFVANPPTLFTRAADKGFSNLSVSAVGMLDTQIKLASTGNASVTEAGTGVLQTQIKLNAVSAISLTATGIFSAGRKWLFSTAVVDMIGDPPLVGGTPGDYGDWTFEPPGTPATVAFTATGDLTCYPTFVATLAEVFITAHADLTTNFNLQASSTISLRASAPLLYGVNFFSNAANTARVGITSSARLRTPILGTTTPDEAARIQARPALVLMGHTYTSIKAAV
jgi:hypothetical protein